MPKSQAISVRGNSQSHSPSFSSPLRLLIRLRDSQVHGNPYSTALDALGARPPHTPKNSRITLRPSSQAIMSESPIFGQGLAASEDGLEIFLVRAVDGENGSFTVMADYQENPTLEDSKALADSAMGLDLSFLESDQIELLNDAGIYDASARQMDKIILRKEKLGDEETFRVDVCYSMEHNGKAVILTLQFPGLDVVFATFPLTAGGFELSADIDNEAYNAQYAAFTPVSFADKNGEDVAARIQDVINLAPESDPNALPSLEYYSHLALIKDFHKHWNEETQTWEDLPVTADTIMVVLSVSRSSDAKELGNHIKVVDPNLPSRFVIDDTFLPNIEFEKQQQLIDSLQMKCSLVCMDVAPSVRVELSWPPGERAPCKAVWDIAFTGGGALEDLPRPFLRVHIDIKVQRW